MWLLLLYFLSLGWRFYWLSIFNRGSLLVTFGRGWFLIRFGFLLRWFLGWRLRHLLFRLVQQSFRYGFHVLALFLRWLLTFLTVSLLRLPLIFLFAFYFLYEHIHIILVFLILQYFEIDLSGRNKFRLKSHVLLRRQRKRNLLVDEPCSFRFLTVLFPLEYMRISFLKSALVQLLIVDIESLWQIPVPTLIPLTIHTIVVMFLNFLMLAWLRYVSSLCHLGGLQTIRRRMAFRTLPRVFSDQMVLKLQSLIRYLTIRHVED